MAQTASQREKLRSLFDAKPILRARDLRAAGIAAETISRALDDGDIERIARGLYQSVDGEIDSDQNLAEIAKRVPRGVVALTSALAFHGLTDQMRADCLALQIESIQNIAPLGRIVRVVDGLLYLKVIAPAGQLEPLIAEVTCLAAHVFERQIGPLAGKKRDESRHRRDTP